MNRKLAIPILLDTTCYLREKTATRDIETSESSEPFHTTGIQTFRWMGAQPVAWYICLGRCDEDSGQGLYAVIVVLRSSYEIKIE